MKTLKNDWKLGAAVGTALSLGSAGAIAGPHGFDLHNVLNGASASFAGTSIAHTEDPVSAVFGNPATLAQYFGGTHFMFGATFYMPRAQMQHDGSAGFAVTELNSAYTQASQISDGSTTTVAGPGLSSFGADSDAYAFDSRSAQDLYAVPQVAVTQDLSGLGIPVVLGVGVTATNGIGVDYQHSSNSIGAAAELINLGVNAGIGMKMSDTLDVGVALTITYAMLEAGLTGSGTQKHDLGFRGTFGARKHMGPLTLGMYYQGELEHQYANLHVTSMHGNSFATTSADGTANALSQSSGADNAAVNAAIKCNGDGTAELSAVCRQDLKVQQPWNIGLGMAMDMGNGMLVMADFTHKAWSDAHFFNEFYDDQNVVSVGIQKTMGNMKLRAGYGYADDPLLSQVQQGVEVATIGGVSVAGNTYSSPMYGLFMSYFQAMETPVIYKHRIAVGLGVESFLGVPFLSLDAHAAVQLEEEKCFGAGQASYTSSTFDTSQAARGIAIQGGLASAGCAATDHTKATVSSFHMGGALTWAF
jgi:long-chain fatty acid transport protein